MSLSLKSSKTSMYEEALSCFNNKKLGQDKNMLPDMAKSSKIKSRRSTCKSNSNSTGVRSNKRARDTDRGVKVTEQATQVVILTKDIHPHDVLCGRGEDVYNHVGNEYFRKVVDEHRDTYLRSILKREKRAIALRIVEHVHARTPRGRFLARTQPLTSKSKRRRRRLSKECNAHQKHNFDLDDPGWIEIPDERAREKAAQALRENAPAIKKKMAISDTVGSSDLDAALLKLREDENKTAAAAVVMPLKPDERPTPIVENKRSNLIDDVAPWDVPKTTYRAEGQMYNRRTHRIVKNVRDAEDEIEKKLTQDDQDWDDTNMNHTSSSPFANLFDLNSTTEKRRSLVVSPDIATTIKECCNSFCDEDEHFPPDAVDEHNNNGCTFDPKVSGSFSSPEEVEQPLKKRWLPTDYVFGSMPCLAGSNSRGNREDRTRGIMTATNTAPRRRSSLRSSLTKQELSLLFDLASLKQEHRSSFCKQLKDDIWIADEHENQEENTTKENIFNSPPMSPLSPVPMNQKGKQDDWDAKLSCSATLTSLLSPLVHKGPQLKF